MGNQQILIIAVAVVIIGIMLAVGIQMFRDQAASSNRDQLASDLALYGAQAQAYMRRPAVFGGGEGSFRGLTMSKVTSQASNLNGSYSMSPDPVPAGADHVRLTGVGSETGLDGVNRVKVVMLVYADSIKVDETGGN